MLSNSSLNIVRELRSSLFLPKPFKEWKKRMYCAPSPNFIKQTVLLRNGAPNATWVETGTYLGRTAELLSKNAYFVYTIEPDPKLYASAKNRLDEIPNVKPINGLSEEVLPSLLRSLKGDVNFWLDGHFSGGLTFQGPIDTPAVEELNSISKTLHKFNRVTVLVDDVRCFNAEKFRNFIISIY